MEHTKGNPQKPESQNEDFWDGFVTAMSILFWGNQNLPEKKRELFSGYLRESLESLGKEIPNIEPFFLSQEEFQVSRQYFLSLYKDWEDMGKAV